MCTLTWWQKQQAYGVFFNRDESVTRTRALPPAVHDAEGSRYICPIDPDGGGTWAWVNEAGLIGCILNNYSAPVGDKSRISRGLLLKSLAAKDSIENIESAIDGLDFNRYRGFHLFLLDGRTAILYSWDGSSLKKKLNDQISPPLTSSGFRPREVALFREDLWRQSNQWGSVGTDACTADTDRLERFHCYHHPDFPAYSPLMQRADARTVSQSRISVGADHISFAYSEVDNLQLSPLHVTTMDRDL